MKNYIKSGIMAAVFLVGALTQAVLAAPADNPLSLEAATEFQFGIPPGVTLEKLVGKPTIVNKFYYSFNDPASGESRISGFADAVVVYDLPVEEFVAMMFACESHDTFIPYFLDVKLLERGVSEDLIEYSTGIKFLGVEVSYNSIFRTSFKRMEGGAVGFRSWLVDSIDDKEFEHFTSYYFEPVLVNGKEMTFFRYFNRPGVKYPTFGMLQGMRFFVPFAIEGHISAMAKEVARRSRL